MAEPPLVSVVIPTYNRATLLRQTLESVAAQEYRPVEAVVVDDGSEDDTGRVIEEAEAQFAEAGLVLRSEVLAGNAGPAAARNAGLRLASGSLTAFLDSDDLWHAQFLSRLVELLERRHPTCGVAFSGNFGIDRDGNVFPEPPRDFGGHGDEGELYRPFERFARGFEFVTSATLVRRRVLDAVGWFDETLASWEDADLWLRIGKRFDFAYTLIPLAYYRIHEGKISWRRLDWYGHQLRVWLRHLDDVTDPGTRRRVVAQIQESQLLLQEELLRRGRVTHEYDALLDNELAPRSLRYRAGRLLMRAPTSLGRCYAATVREAGDLQRWSSAHVHLVRSLLG